MNLNPIDKTKGKKPVDPNSRMAQLEKRVDQLEQQLQQILKQGGINSARK